jgi:hypothetical protein
MTGMMMMVMSGGKKGEDKQNMIVKIRMIMIDMIVMIYDDKSDDTITVTKNRRETMILNEDADVMRNPLWRTAELEEKGN